MNEGAVSGKRLKWKKVSRHTKNETMTEKLIFGFALLLLNVVRSNSGHSSYGAPPTGRYIFSAVQIFFAVILEKKNGLIPNMNVNA